MLQPYNGEYPFNENVVSSWNSTVIGIYYCGFLTATGDLRPLYIGLGTGDAGIRGRLLAHLREKNWSEVTHFGYRACATAAEAQALEAQEISRCQPKYNIQGK